MPHFEEIHPSLWIRTFLPPKVYRIHLCLRYIQTFRLKCATSSSDLTIIESKSSHFRATVLLPFTYAITDSAVVTRASSAEVLYVVTNMFTAIIGVMGPPARRVKLALEAEIQKWRLQSLDNYLCRVSVVVTASGPNRGGTTYRVSFKSPTQDSRPMDARVTCADATHPLCIQDTGGAAVQLADVCHRVAYTRTKAQLSAKVRIERQAEWWRELAECRGKVFPLLELPGELRLKVYHHLLGTASAELIEVHHPRPGDAIHKYPPDARQLMGACRRVHGEISGELHDRRHVFHTWASFEAFVRQPEAPLAGVRHITFRCDMNDYGLMFDIPAIVDECKKGVTQRSDYLAELRRLAEAMPAVEELVFKCPELYVVKVGRLNTTKAKQRVAMGIARFRRYLPLQLKEGGCTIAKNFGQEGNW